MAFDREPESWLTAPSSAHSACEDSESQLNGYIRNCVEGHFSRTAKKAADQFVEIVSLVSFLQLLLAEYFTYSSTIGNRDEFLLAQVRYDLWPDECLC